MGREYAPQFRSVKDDLLKKVEVMQKEHKIDYQQALTAVLFTEIVDLKHELNILRI